MADEKKKVAKLSGAQLRKLRALGHNLDPVVAVGKDGVTDALVRATETALETHELIKVKTQREAPTDRHEAAIDLAARTGSVLAQVIGRTFLLYKARPDEAASGKAKGKEAKKKAAAAARKAKPRIDLSPRTLKTEKRAKAGPGRSAAPKGESEEPVESESSFDEEDGDNLVDE